jgi:hypothetical protein
MADEGFSHILRLPAKGLFAATGLFGSSETGDLLHTISGF